MALDPPGRQDSPSPAGQDLGTPPGVVGGPLVAATDPAGHAVAVVGAIHVVPARVAAERAGPPNEAALTAAFDTVPAGDAVAVGAGDDAPLAWWGDGRRHGRHLARHRSPPRMHHDTVRLQPLVRPRAQERRRRRGLVVWAAGSPHLGAVRPG